MSEKVDPYLWPMLRNFGGVNTLGDGYHIFMPEDMIETFFPFDIGSTDEIRKLCKDYLGVDLPRNTTG